MKRLKKSKKSNSYIYTIFAPVLLLG